MEINDKAENLNLSPYWNDKNLWGSRTNKIEVSFSVVDKFTPAINKILYNLNTQDIDYIDVTGHDKLLSDGSNER